MGKNLRMNKSSSYDTYWDTKQKIYAPFGNWQITMHLCQGVSTGGGQTIDSCLSDSERNYYGFTIALML